MHASPAALARVWRGRRLPWGCWWSAAVGSAAERFKRGCAARGRACRGEGARGGVDDVSMSSGDGR
jgi:hypothetical protein